MTTGMDNIPKTGIKRTINSMDNYGYYNRRDESWPMTSFKAIIEGLT